MNPLPKENIYGHTKKLQFVLEQVDRYIKLHGKPISILDFGCGNGIAVSQYLIQEGIRFYGVDIHEPSLRYAREHFENENAFFVNHVPEEILFDIIVYADILEHLECPVTILQRHYDRLKEHGLIIGSVPNGYGPFEIEKRMDKWFNLSAGFRLAVGIKGKLRRSRSSCATIIAYNADSEHVHYFKKTSLRSALERSGFLVQCFKNGPFLGGPLTERLLRSQWVTRMNSNIGDLLPYWLASTWYFTAKKREIDKMISDLLSGKKAARQPYKMECQNVKGIAKRELLELTLFLRWIKCWEWVDHKGRVSEGQSILRILKNLFRDLVLWPYIYWTRLRGIIQLKQAIHFQGTMGAEPVVLFLRTDHWFNVKSGGSVGHLSGVIHGLRTLGFRTHVVSTDQLVGVEENGCFHLCEPAYELGRNIPNLSEILYNDRLLRFIEEHWAIWSPSFIYQRYSLGNYTGVLLKNKYRVPFICEYNGSFIWMSRHWGSRRLLHKKLINQIELLNLYGADLIVVVSQALKDELVARGMDVDKILVNPNGVDPDLYSPYVDGSAVRNRYHLNGKTVIGFIGTFGKWHGAEILAEAFGKFLEKFPAYQGQVTLFMIGDGVNVPLVKENLKKFDMEKSCILTGLIPQEKGPEYLATCDILVASHRPNPDGTPFFGSPTKLFEYMAMGKGIVASNLDQIGEVLKHDQTAILVKPGDVESLMAGLKVLIDDEERRIRLGQSARREVVAKYTWKMHTEKIIQKLKEHCR